MATTQSGVLHKMVGKLDSPVSYALQLSESLYPLNAFIGQEIHLLFMQKIQCIACGRNTKKSFNQGFCFPCSQSLARCDLCIVKPERCHFHLGTCREPEWGQQHCMIPHIIYLANSSGVKVGITRETQIPTRWIDQGATQALPILRVASRYQSGLLEIQFAKHLADKTNWRKMLSGSNGTVNLYQERDTLLDLCASEIQQIQDTFPQSEISTLPQAVSTDIKYPVHTYPEKITSHNFDKHSEVNGILQGVKGQYLILDTGVLNVRKFTGYHTQITLPG